MVNHKYVLRDIATGEYELTGNDDTLSPACTPSIGHAEVYDTAADAQWMVDRTRNATDNSPRFEVVHLNSH